MKNQISYGIRAAKSQDGMVLLSAILVLTAISLIAIGLTNDSVTNLEVTGNKKMHHQLFQVEDGSLDLGIAVIRDYLNVDIGVPEDLLPDNEGTYALADGLYMSQFAVDANLRKDLESEEGYDNYYNPVTGDLGDPANGSPDISYLLTSDSATFPDTEVTIDLDRLNLESLAGYSMEFAAGYDGVGKSGAHGSTVTYYTVRAQAAYSGVPSTEPGVASVYGKVNLHVDE